MKEYKGLYKSNCFFLKYSLFIIVVSFITNLVAQDIPNPPSNLQQLNRGVDANLLVDRGLMRAIGANGGYLYNCTSSQYIGWFRYCKAAEHLTFNLNNNNSYYLKDFNYSMNSDWFRKNSLSLKLGASKSNSMLLGGESVVKNSTNERKFYESGYKINNDGKVYIGLYSGGNTTLGTKYMTEFSIENIKDLYLGGDMYIGGHYSMRDLSIYGGGGARVTFNVENNIYSNANINLTQCAHNNCENQYTELIIKGKNFYSSGTITMGYTKDGLTYYSKATKLDLSGVKNSFINKIISGAQYSKDNKYDDANKSLITAQNIMINEVQLKWNGANLTISSTPTTNNTAQNGSDKWSQSYKKESEKILNRFNGYPNLDSKKFILINKLSNSTTGNLNSGVSASLQTNSDVLIGEIFHNNAAGGQTLRVDADSKFGNGNNTQSSKKDIVVGSIHYK